MRAGNAFIVHGNACAKAVRALPTRRTCSAGLRRRWRSPRAKDDQAENREDRSQAPRPGQMIGLGIGSAHGVLERGAATAREG